MTTEKIKEIRIDDSGRLCIFPENATFSQIFRLANGVNWDNGQRFLYSSPPREWSYVQWYNHIINVAAECGYDLVLTDETIWTKILPAFKDQIITN